MALLRQVKVRDAKLGYGGPGKMKQNKLGWVEKGFTSIIFYIGFCEASYREAKDKQLFV